MCAIRSRLFSALCKQAAEADWLVMNTVSGRRNSTQDPSSILNSNGYWNKQDIEVIL